MPDPWAERFLGKFKTRSGSASVIHQIIVIESEHQLIKKESVKTKIGMIRICYKEISQTLPYFTGESDGANSSGDEYDQAEYISFPEKSTVADAASGKTSS